MTGVIAGMIGGMVTVPGEPTALSATSHANAQSVLTWTPPAGNGGSPITDYVVQYSTSATFASAVTTFTDGVNASTGATVTGLSNGTTHYFRVAAVNSVGTGAYSTISAGAVPSTVPNVPTNVQGTSNGVTSSTVTWTAPAAANTGPNFTDITGYKVEYAISPYSSYTVFTADTGNTNTSISVTGLTNGGSYKFKVTAKNSNGLGTTSAESAVVVTNIVPAAPTIGTMTRGTGGSTTDTLAWTVPTANGGSAITGYVYALSTDSYATATATGSTTVSFAFNPGYTSATTTVKIAAVNSLGTGPYSDASAVGFGGWALGAASDNTDTCPSVSCTCAACDCGTSTGTNSTQTKTRDCYTWTRSGNSASTVYNSNGTTACTSVYSACSGGSCASCTGCASYTSAAKTGNFNEGGISYTYTGTAGSYYAYPNPTCSNGCDFSSAYYTVTVCNGTNTIALTSSDACLNVFAEPC